jgi:shikimate dehydrogenase
MSPKMHNAAFRELGLNYVYRAVSIEPERLSEFVNIVMRGSDVLGANVTVPHKIAMMDEIDDLDSNAAAIGAINTIVNNGGVLKGYNTDGLGAYKALKEFAGELEDKKVVLIGAGGAARAVSYSIIQEAETLTILNRTFERAQVLAKSLRSIDRSHARVTSAPLDELHLKRELEDADILINSTSIGMHPNVVETPVPGHLLHDDMLVFDLVYNPSNTRLLREAEEAGADTLSGIEMLVYQGAEAFRLWTGKKAPVDLMLRVVRRELGA